MTDTMTQTTWGVVRACLDEALAQLQPLPPTPTRTAIGRAILAARRLCLLADRP